MKGCACSALPHEVSAAAPLLARPLASPQAPPLTPSGSASVYTKCSNARNTGARTSCTTARPSRPSRMLLLSSERKKLLRASSTTRCACEGPPPGARLSGGPRDVCTGRRHVPSDTQAPARSPAPPASPCPAPPSQPLPSAP
jgi:hypothetical protein